MDKLANSEDAKRFLLSLGLHVDESVVKQVANILSGKADRSLYSLYATRPDNPLPVCGKGTAYKIKELYDKGALEPYLAYLSQGPTFGGAEPEQAKREAPPEDDVAKISGVGKEEAKPGKIAGGAGPPESKPPLQEFLVERGVLKLAAKFKDNLSTIDALDGAVYQLFGDPWTTDIPSVLYVSGYPEIKVVLAIEHNQHDQFLLLTEQLEPISPGFLHKFREWEERSLMPLIGRGQDLIREIWYKAREGTGLEMSFYRGYSLPHEYGFLQNVPFFVYSFALKHYAESNPPEPKLELKPADVDRFPYLAPAPFYRQLTCPDYPNLLLAAGFGLVEDNSRGMIDIDVMDLCKLVTIELCQLYAQDDNIRKIVKEQEALQREREPFLKALTDFLRSSSSR
jgi:hypothetical protein